MAILPLRPGNYVFIGLQDDDESRHESTHGTRYMSKWRVVGSEDYRDLVLHVRVNFEEVKDEEAESKATGIRLFEGWKYPIWDSVTSTLQYRDLLSKRWNVIPIAPDEMLKKIEKVDVSAEYGIKGLTVLRFYYAQSPKERKYITVMVADNPEKIQRVVTIRQSQIFFSWDTWRDIKHPDSVPAK